MAKRRRLNLEAQVYRSEGLIAIGSEYQPPQAPQRRERERDYDAPPRGSFKPGPYIWMRLETPEEMVLFEVPRNTYEQFDYNDRGQIKRRIAVRVSDPNPCLGDIELARLKRQQKIVNAVENHGHRIKKMVTRDDLNDDFVLWGSEKREATAFKALFSQTYVRTWRKRNERLLERFHEKNMLQNSAGESELPLIGSKDKSLLVRRHWQSWRGEMLERYYPALAPV